MHADEIDIDARLVRGLLAEQFPYFAELALRRVTSSGTDNAIFRLGVDKLVRLPRIEAVVATVKHEQKWLRRLAPFLPVEISTPLGIGRATALYPWDWSIYDWLSGENPTVGNIEHPESLAGDLADFILALQRIDLAGGPFKTTTLAMRDDQVRRDLAALEGRIDTQGALAVWQDALTAPGWVGPPVWVHGDLSPGNLLIRNGRLAAVIDFAGVGVGDPCEDLRIAWNLLPAQVRPTFRTRLNVDDATWIRGRARALAQALVQLPYYWDTNPALAANARHVVSEIVAEARSTL